MTDHVEFVVFGSPVPFARAGGGLTKRRFTPPKQRDYMLYVRAAAHLAMAGRAPLDGPLRMSVQAIYDIPSSWSKKKRAEALSRPTWKESRPDLDNIIKALKDSLGTNDSLAAVDKLPAAIVFNDDAQVASLDDCAKLYGDKARVVVRVQRLT